MASEASETIILVATLRRGEDLALSDSVVGANLSAAAAADALIGVDVIDVAGSDSADGAYGLTGAASDAVVADYVSHSSLF